MGDVASAESGVGGVANSEDKMAEEAIAAISRDGGDIGVQLGGGQVEAVICGFGARRMSCEDGGVRKGAHDVSDAAVGGHGESSDEATSRIKLTSSDEEVNSEQQAC